MSISAFASLSLVELADYKEFALLMACYHHLGYALTVVHGEVGVGEIDEQHHDLAAIVGIHSAWSVEHGDAMLKGKTAARAYLCLVTHGHT